MIKKVLVANRGEIAIRILRACRELGLLTVAVFSEADRQALHVRYADEAYLIGPAPARESYLRMDKILEIARKCGADAIHPGYGFLAERADFAQACLEHGIGFIGPKPSAIAAMGDKAMARKKVSSAGVEVVPGTEGEGALRDDDLIAIAPKIGFPLLIKATAGGGGRGMREVNSPDEMPGLLRTARQEAEAAFGDGNVYLEKLLQGARHVEIQILADQMGNTIYLGERECSIQRRHQKLLEESPSPFFAGKDNLRQKMGEVAVRASQAVEYLNTGTIEFLVEENSRFYFLEMNTRLQVEHPVTEMVTGVDIVKEQIHIAQGLPLRYSQKDIHINGYAIECRINAEDPYNDFYPSTGFISFMFPPTGPGVRIDSGVYPGFEISPYYDSLISKLIVWGETRQEAIFRMRRALAEYVVIGVRTNIPFHQKLLESKEFLDGQFDTFFIEQRFLSEFLGKQDEEQARIAAILASLAAHRETKLSTQKIGHGGCERNNWSWSGRQENMR